MWTPTQDRISKSQLKKFQAFCDIEGDYQSFHQYSIKNKTSFWDHLISFYKIKFSGNLNPALVDDNFKTYSWYNNVLLNFSENLLLKGDPKNCALSFIHESGLRRQITYQELRLTVGSLSHFLTNIMSCGDVLAAYMPNIPETVMAMLAANSFGGVFTSTSCDFGIEGVLDRFTQSKPKVLIAAVGYEYNGKYFDLHARLIEIEKRLPSLQKIILVDFLGRGINLDGFTKAVTFSDAIKESAELRFTQLPFSHPLYIMYSSGTTGKPKCIVHSQGGTLLGHVKELGLHTDLTRDKTIFFFTTCGWMMWNWLVSSLFFGSKVILYEGSPTLPSPEHYFKIIDRESISIFGTSPKFLKALEDTNAQFNSEFKTLETILSTGSPLLPEQYDYVYSKIKKDVMLASISGGTDIVGCFMLGNPTMPVYLGEIQSLGLALDIAALNDAGTSVIDLEGELVCRQTFPNRPIGFLDDENFEKINAAYFNQIPGVWTHGDFVKITNLGGVIVYGRSDATLNPGGVRIGTAEIYRQVEKIPEVMESIVIGQDWQDDTRVILFVKLREHAVLDEALEKNIRQIIRINASPRHVPAKIISVPEIPRTLSGKIVEIAVRQAVHGQNIQNLGALANPEALSYFKNRPELSMT